MSQTIDVVYSDYNTPGIPSSGEKQPKKAEVRALLKQIQNGSGQSVTRNTVTALNAVTPPNENYMGIALTGAGAGYYYRSGAAWVFGRGFPDTLAGVTLAGSANAQTGTVSAGVDPGTVLEFIATPSTANTGPMTLDMGSGAKPVLNYSGNPLAAGEWATFVRFRDDGAGSYRLTIDANAAAVASAAATAAGTNADNAEDAADRAELAAAGVEYPVSYAVQDLTAAQRAQARANLNVGATFATVAAMVASTKLVVGQCVRTQGYYAAGDGGGNDYLIVAAATGTADGGSFINLSGISGQAQAAFSNGCATLKHWGAKGDRVADDTATVQAALNYVAAQARPFQLRAPAGTYRVTQITFFGIGHNYILDDAIFEGIAASAKTSVVQLKLGLGQMSGLKVSGARNTYYECGVHWYTNDLGTYYPGRNQFDRMHINECLIGLVIGGRPNQGAVTHAQGDVVADGLATNAPLSESYIHGLETTDCVQALYFNQPNGKVCFSDSNICSEDDNWVSHAGVPSCAFICRHGEMFISGGSIEQIQDTSGYLWQVVGPSNVHITGAVIEAVSEGYIAAQATLRISQTLNWGLNGDRPFLTVDKDATGMLITTDMFFYRTPAYVGSNAVLKSVNGLGGAFSPCMEFRWHYSNVEFRDCNFAVGATYNPLANGVRAITAGDCLITAGNIVGSDWVRSSTFRFAQGTNILRGKVDLSMLGVTAYGTNGSATVAGYNVTVSGAGSKDWGKVQTGLPTVAGESPQAVFKMVTSPGGVVLVECAEADVEPLRLYVLHGLIKTNGTTATTLIRARYKKFDGTAASSNVDGFNGQAVALAGTTWRPFMIRLGPSPYDAAKMVLSLQAQDGAELQFCNLRIE